MRPQCGVHFGNLGRGLTGRIQLSNVQCCEHCSHSRVQELGRVGLTVQEYPLGWGIRKKFGRKERERIRLHSPYRKINNCWPEISAAAFPLWVTHESSRYIQLVTNLEKLPFLIPPSSTKVSILYLSVFSCSQRRALEMTGEAVGMNAYSEIPCTLNTESEGTFRAHI